jgi:hypothetical protein
MDAFMYEASAELFPSRRYAKTAREQYRRFRTAAEAIQFIMEEVPSSWLNGSLLEVNERRYDGAGIRRLYEANDYPLQRRQAAA